MDITDIAKITDLGQLEAIGKSLSPAQVHRVLSCHTMLGEGAYIKLAALLVGMQPDVFFDLMNSATGTELDVLKLEGISEPVQFQLLQFYNKMRQEVDKLNQAVTNLENEIDALEPSTLGLKDVQALLNKIAAIIEPYQHIIPALDKSLIIVWNTDRLDLIEKLSNLKERAKRLIVKGIGYPRTDTQHPTGLYGRLEEHLFAVYNHVPGEYLKEDDPALEALAKLSIWYIKDYFSVGLLPEILSEEQLELDPKRHSEKECQQHRNKLLDAAHKELERHGLITLKDLKRAGIFSKKSLIEYLSKQ